MYRVSSRFLKRLAEGYPLLTQVTLFRPDGTVANIEHTGGSVTVDRAQAIRRTCTVTGCDTSLIPRAPVDQIAVYGARMRIAVGVDYGDGTQELVPQGVFRLDSISGDPAFGPVTLTGKAIEVAVQDDKFTNPYRAVGSVVPAVTDLIRRSLPDAEVVSEITDVPIGATTWDVQGDPWAAVQEIAATAGAEVAMNGDGVFVISVLPDLATVTPVWSVEATEGGVYVSGTRAMTSEGVCNAVLASGESSGEATPPVSYLAVDNDPGSPTRWDGPYGHRPLFYSSSTLTTVGACQLAAGLKLDAARAPNATGDLSALPNPALELGDVIRVLHPDGLRELHQVASFSVPLDLGGEFPLTTISAKEDA